MKRTTTLPANGSLGRRGFLGMIGASALAPHVPLKFLQFAADMSKSLSKEQRDNMTPAQVMEELKKGNERFRSGKPAPAITLRRSGPAQQVNTPPQSYWDVSIPGFLLRSFLTPVSATPSRDESRETW